MLKDLYDNDIFIFEYKEDSILYQDKEKINDFITNLFYQYSLYKEMKEEIGLMKVKCIDITDNIKIKKIKNFKDLANGNIISSLILNYYHTESIKLKEILYEVIINNLDINNDYLFLRDDAALFKIMYFNKFLFENDIENKNINIETVYNSAYISYQNIVKIIRDEDVEFFKNNLDIMSERIIKDIDILYFLERNSYTEIFDYEKEESVIELFLDYIYISTKNEKYWYKLFIMNKMYDKFYNNFSQLDNILDLIEDTVDKIIKSRIKNVNYKEFNKEYLFERIKLYQDNFSPESYLYDEIKEYLKDEEANINHAEYYAYLYFFNSYMHTDVDPIFKEALTNNETSDDFFIKLLDLINKNMTYKEKRRLLKDILNSGNIKYYSDTDTYRYLKPSFLVSKSKGELKKIIMHDTVKKTFI